jgi:hypothetical protein
VKRLFILGVFIISGITNAKTLATIGNEAITTEDVNRFKIHLYYSGAPKELLDNEDAVLDYIINMKLSVMEAKRTGLDQTAGAKDAVEGSLYNYYLTHTVNTKFKNKKYGKQEILDYYKKYPVVKIQRLALPFMPNNDRSKAEVFKKISILRSEAMNNSKMFEATVMQYSQNDITTLNGTFDKVPSAMLSMEERQAINTTPVSELSPVLAGPNYFSVIKTIKIYPISSGDYKPISEILRGIDITNARNEQVKALRQKYSSIINIK